MPEKRRIAIVCGTGNNGGDGLVLARLLGSCSSAETYILDFGRHSADFDINLERLKQCQSAKIHCLGISDSLVVSADTELLIDAVFGTGLSRVAEGPYADAIAAMNRCHDALRIAIDVPSGLFADEHTPNGAAVFQADVTLTFQFAKQAFLFAENHRFVGNFVVLPIGLSHDYIDNEPTQRFLVDHISLPDNVANRPKFSHKGTFGHVLLVAGSYGKMGGNWRMPTTEECQELIDNCTFENVGQYGRTLMKATGPNGNYILFPHTGTTKMMEDIYCWTSDLSVVDNHATCFNINYISEEANISWYDRYAGLTIRAVCP